MNQEKILKILCDLTDTLEVAAVNSKHQISELAGASEESAWNPNNIKWEQGQGTFGPHERAEQDLNSPHFKQPVKDPGLKTSKSWIFFAVKKES
jgi:hypothetical protein